MCWQAVEAWRAAFGIREEALDGLRLSSSFLTVSTGVKRIGAPECGVQEYADAAACMRVANERWYERHL